MAQLKLDGLMFDHIYADLMMLSKSNALAKSVMDMNVHYRELQQFLQKVAENPKIIMNINLQVFPSEQSLYKNTKTNHRISKAYPPVRIRLYKPDEFDDSNMLPQVACAASTMLHKLNDYMRHQLPGGKFHNPSPEQRKILEKLRPNNDCSESVLGLNDYLATALPNTCQQTRSNLVEVSKNKTLDWLDGQSTPMRNKIVQVAISKRSEMAYERKQLAQHHREVRQKQVEAQLEKAQSRNQKRAAQKQRLQQEELITTTVQLEEARKETSKPLSNTDKSQESCSWANYCHTFHSQTKTKANRANTKSSKAI